MKRSTFLRTIIIALQLFCFSAVNASQDFKLVKQEGAVSLYERWIPAGPDDMVREIKAVLYVRAGASEAIGLLCNQLKGTTWNTNASEYRVLKTADASEWTTYIRYRIPWPMDDQDCCMHYSIKHISANLTEVPFESTAAVGFPIRKGATRINKIKGMWQLEQAGAGIRITYIVSTERSKKLPRCVSDPIVHNNLFKTMTAFKTNLENNSNDTRNLYAGNRR